MTPRRVQLSRRKGARLPPNTVVVARPSKWGNPFRIGQKNPYGTITKDLRHSYLIYSGFAPTNKELIDAAQAELKGKNLACWCPLDQPCHGDILLRLANA